MLLARYFCRCSCQSKEQDALILLPHGACILLRGVQYKKKSKYQTKIISENDKCDEAGLIKLFLFCVDLLQVTVFKNLPIMLSEDLLCIETGVR